MSEPITLRPSLHEAAFRRLELVDGQIAIVEMARRARHGEELSDYSEPFPSGQRVLAVYPFTRDGNAAADAALAAMEREVLHRRAEIVALLEKAARTAEAERRERIARAKAEKRCATCRWCMHITGDERHLLCGRVYKDGAGIVTPPTEKEVGARSFDAALHPRVTADHGCAHHELDQREII